MKAVAGVVIAGMLCGSGLLAQGRPDLSGTWVPADPAAKPVAVSGGVFNCGAECTIAQTPTNLVVSRPPDGQGAKPRDVVISWEAAGGATPQGRWDGNNLVLTRTLGPTKVVQTLSVEAGRLVVVSVASPGEIAPLTQVYVKVNKGGLAAGPLFAR